VPECVRGDVLVGERRAGCLRPAHVLGDQALHGVCAERAPVKGGEQRVRWLARPFA
jgi:hypothetical protein